MSEPLLSLENVGLQVPALTPKERQLMHNPVKFLMDFYVTRSSRQTKTLLSGISFNLERDDRIGIIGLNGAGKSTLIRLLAGIYKPTEGNMIINGTATGMFSVSMGMNANATGHENIYLRGLQMGLTLQEIKARIPAIMEFTQLEKDIHKVYGNYSSGMRLRLAFAISTMITPDILVMDEWLGAGDARFKQKVTARMNRLLEKSRGLILASHNESLLSRMCTKGLVLDNGNQMFFGPLNEALEYFEDKVKLPFTKQGQNSIADS